MGYPTAAKTWTIAPNNTITFVSLVDTMRTFLKGVADFLLANGYTCKGSCDGTTGAMDAVNRWTTAANAGTRSTSTTAANSWMVLTDGNGCNICLSYVGSADDHARIAYSTNGLYVAAGTPTFTPTATDELVLLSGVTLIGATASADRIWNGWVDSTAKLCRFAVYRSGALTGSVWGVELVDHLTTQNWVGPKVWGFGFLAGAFTVTNAFGNSFPSNYAINSNGGLTRVNQTFRVGGGVFNFYGSPGPGIWENVQTGLQGGVGYPIFGPLSIAASLDASGNGVSGGIIGRLFDWWTGRSTGVTPGVTYNNKTLVGLGSGAILWPWDGSTTPVNGGAAPGTLDGYWHINNPLTVEYAAPMSCYDNARPLAFNAVTPIGPSTPKTFARRSGVDVIRLQSMSADPPAEAGKVLLYTRLIGGQQALFARYPSGTVTMLGSG